MKIGIFGDSYAVDKKLNPTDSWIDVLRKHFEVEVYAEPASSLFFSVSNFKQHNQKYDKNIFIVTMPGRIKISDRVPILQRHVAGIPNTDWHLERVKKENSPVTFKVYQAVLDYYNYIQDDLFDDYVHSLMLEDIKTINQNTIFIPAFKNSFPGKNTITSLFDVYLKENKKFNIHSFSLNLEDIRNCHMTYENNLILGNKIVNCIKTGVDLELVLDDFVEPDNKEFYIKEQI